MSNRYLAAGLVISVAALAGCAQPPYYEQQAGYSPAAYPVSPPAYPAYGAPVYSAAAPAYAEYGHVANIEVMRSEQPRAPSGVGAILGAVLGGVVGHEIGHGFGRAAATGVGVFGGALAGNAVEGNQRGPIVQNYRILVQIDHGRMQAFDVPSPGDLRVGDRVRVENGQIQRI